MRSQFQVARVARRRCGLLRARHGRRPCDAAASTAPTDGFARLDVRVPNERDDSATTKVDVRLPPGFAFVSYEPARLEGDLKRTKLDQPIKTDEGFRSTRRSRRSRGRATAPAAGSDRASSWTSASPCACQRASRVTSSRSRRCRPTTTARWCAGSARGRRRARADRHAHRRGLGGGHGAPGTTGATTTSAARPARPPSEGRRRARHPRADRRRRSLSLRAWLRSLVPAVPASRPDRKEP